MNKVRTHFAKCSIRLLLSYRIGPQKSRIRGGIHFSRVLCIHVIGFDGGIAHIVQIFHVCVQIMLLFLLFLFFVLPSFFSLLIRWYCVIRDVVIVTLFFVL